MPVHIRPAGAVLRRGRSPVGNWCRLIIAVALIATTLTGFLTCTIPPLPFIVASIQTPSSTFAATNSTRRDSIIFALDARNSALIANIETRIDASKKMSNATRSETHVKKVISGGSDLLISSRQEVSNEFILKDGINVRDYVNNYANLKDSSFDQRHRKMAEPHAGDQKVPFWALPPDEALLYAKKEIENAPLVADDPYLYAPVFRNLSVFKRSYELMEKVLKVYIYPDGSRPIFHTPQLQGIYASEGWFMKLMEESRVFTVRDPKKAHLFYLPYSSRQLRDALYTPGSHNIKPLAIFLRDYVNNISSKYPFWNRRRGADHFLVACHDWGPYSTTMHAELFKNTIKALCNADTSEGIFIRGKDVSLPETAIKIPKRPLRYIGGKRVSQRPILAFYAGLMHGRVRPTLEKLWGNNTDGDLRIFRRLPNRISRNMSYVDHMKSSRFCICPMGYEVNSPRIVEAIYYECVPVIIADNFVLPFEEVLNWSAFSVVVAEKDMADLKKILLGIPLARYLRMQERVKRVQKHFLWHAKPEKYDLFHFILHSIWSSRLNQNDRIPKPL